MLGTRALVSMSFYAVVPFAAVAAGPMLGLAPAGSLGLVALAALAGRLLSWPIGRLTDRVGAGSLLRWVAAATLAIGLWALVAPSAGSALAFLLGLATLNPTANIALRVLVATSNRPRRRSLAFGLLGSAKTIGIAAGPALVGLLFAPDAWNVIVGTALASLALALALLPGANRANGCVQPGTVQGRPRGGAALPVGVPAMIAAIWLLVWTGLNAITVGLATLFAVHHDDLRAAATFFVVQSLLSAVLLVAAGAVLARADLHARTIVFATAATGVPVALLVLGLAPVGSALVVALVVAMIIAVSEALTVPTLDTIVAETAGGSLGGGFGRLATLEALGAAAGLALAAGLAIEHGLWSIAGNWALAGTAMSVVATALAVAILRRTRAAGSPSHVNGAS
ncbi:MFS transporter [Salinarimonas ramus]|uniref:MFS transporter n=1 Tax=Salinarimonas ramus TaxID=690164 RepID=UPI00166B2EC9|nr:MFS transporter [Salinarimonas ramus]